MEQTIPWLVFCLAFLSLSIWRPRAARVFIGVFFIVMGIAVNWVLALADPQTFVGLGTDAPLLSAHEWVFTEVVARAPQAVGILAGAGEIALGVLMLSRDSWARLGLAGGIGFLLLITPVGVWTLPNPEMAAGLAYLLTRPADQSLPDLIRARRRRSVTRVPSIHDRAAALRGARASPGVRAAAVPLPRRGGGVRSRVLRQCRQPGIQRAVPVHHRSQ
ncbi:hypothetical protein C8N39_101218 [Dietzia psychralcaliphila]|nr:hypothetical protein [Dietzia psychralcaliphila]PTM90465.1 hypothetical protein C8N39_101218 [Dietzia psychralcaliphila]